MAFASKFDREGIGMGCNGRDQCTRLGAGTCLVTSCNNVNFSRKEVFSVLRGLQLEMAER
jgi:hypothetical protein